MQKLHDQTPPNKNKRTDPSNLGALRASQVMKFQFVWLVLESIEI